MANPIQSILRKATRKEEEPLNILCAATHERQQSAFGHLPHSFWMYQHPSFKEWKTKYAPVPQNHHPLNIHKQEDQLPPWVDFDLVLSQNKFGQFQILGNIAKQLDIPLISVEHTLPPQGWPKSKIQECCNMRGDIDVFVSEYQRIAWGFPESHGCINHTGIDTTVFRDLQIERRPTCLSIVNDWINRDWCCGYKLWEEVIRMAGRQLPVTVVGDTPGLSEPAKDIEELVNHYNTASVYLNTTLISSLPTVIIEAMACGCPVVSTATCLIPKIMIEHGVNGFCSNDPVQLNEYCHMLLNDKKLAEDIGKAGRETVLEKFSMENFVQTWEEIFDEAIRIRK
jgi:hypothetical protein